MQWQAVGRAKLPAIMTSHTLRDAPRPPSPMSTLESFWTSSKEPLGLRVSAQPSPAAFDGAAAYRFELSSRGDRVPGRLLLPSAPSGPCPAVVVLGVPSWGCADAAYDVLSGFVDRGIAVATIDLSLYGERKSAKFSERLIAATEHASQRGPLDANGRALLVEFTHQSVNDVHRTLDALGSLPSIERNRTAILGVDYGAAIATLAAATDPRILSAVLARCPAVAVDEIDPRRFAAAIGPREVLVLDDERTDAEESIFPSCSEPRTRHVRSDVAGALDRDATRIALEFLASQLGL